MVRDNKAKDVSSKKTVCEPGRRFSVTFYKYDINKLPTIESFDGDCKFLIYQSEICSTTGRLHLQMYMEFTKVVRFTYIQKVLDCKVHCENAFSTQMYNAYYCSKRFTYNEDQMIRYKSFGDDYKDLPDFVWGRFHDEDEVRDYIQSLTEKKSVPKKKTQGARNDLVKLTEFIANYSSYSDCLQAATADIRPSLVKYKQYVIDMIASRPREKCDWWFPTYRCWQSDLLKILSVPADDRTIVFIVDPVGGNGKSQIFEYIYRNFNAFYAMGREDNISRQYNLETVILCDSSRDHNNAVNYTSLEALKNGILVSSKYEPITKIRPRGSNAHIIVNMNEYPDRSKLSYDRYVVYDITDTGLKNVTESFLKAPTKVLNKCKTRRIRLSEEFDLAAYLNFKAQKAAQNLVSVRDLNSKKTFKYDSAINQILQADRLDNCFSDEE